MYSNAEKTQLVPPLRDELQMIENGFCTPFEMKVTLENYGAVPFLESVSDTMIILSSPSSDVYVGSHKGILTYYDDKDNVLGQLSFDIIITSS